MLDNDEAFLSPLRVSQQNIAGILYRFYHDATNGVTSDSRDELLGEWVGTYTVQGFFANVGVNGLSISVYQVGENYRAVVFFYPIEGSPATQRIGSWFADVRFNETTGDIDLIATTWRERPSATAAPSG